IDLALFAEHVSIVLSELTQAEQTVEHPGGFTSVHQTELGETQGKVSVRGRHPLNNLNVARATHGLEREGPSFFSQHEHLLSEVLPVAAALPNGLIQQLRSAHFLVLVSVQLLPGSVLQQPVEDKATGVPEDHSRRFLLEMEEVQALAQRAMVVFIKHDSTAPIGRLAFSGRSMRACAVAPAGEGGAWNCALLFRPASARLPSRRCG